MKKLLPALSLLLLAALAVSSCGDAADDTKTTDAVTDDTAAVVTEEPTEADQRAKIPDNLPETDMNNYQFRVWTRDREDFVEDIGFDLEESGEVIDDAVYSRNQTVEERFNVELVQRAVVSGMFNAELTKSITSGDDSHDLALGQVTSVPTLCTEGYFLDWYEDLPHVDLRSPWYIGNAAEALSVNGHAYSMIGELNLDVLRFTYCIYFNKNIAANYDLENMYQVVEEGRWTYDYLRKLATEVYSDLNGDSKKSEDDLLCISGDPHSAAITYQYAFDNPTFTIGEDKIPYLSMDTAKANDIAVKLNDLYWNTQGGYTLDWNSGGTAWGNGTLLFKTGLFDSAINYRDIDNFEFGIIPYPKYDEAQTNYYTMSDGAHGVMTVPITITNPEYTSIIIEALNAETYKQVVPAYYDISLKVKFSRDDESGRVLDLLMDGRVFDFGYVYQTGLPFVLDTLVSANNGNSESFYASKMKSAQKVIDKVINAYLELE